ncbi:hypothetical protein ROZALSC1DRAFT_30585 [Rozella allomycis CSF55]|uniref:Uncharacterized protein n=1 Tax=Rozella allomycis (strain CSF55) TaxID=988480 RepID=A0A4V1IZD1_ROZAC|nr:hypothetical protein ROZALSC1DRAFT_30585 [Rozella allomycis CSF55]
MIKVPNYLSLYLAEFLSFETTYGHRKKEIKLFYANIADQKKLLLLAEKFKASAIKEKGGVVTIDKKSRCTE